MPANGVMAQRNTRIVEALNAGASVASVAGAYNLSPSRVRSIRARTAQVYAASPNGSTPTAGSLPPEVGASGLKYSWGYVQEEFLTELSSSAARYRIFNEMRSNDPVIGGALLATELSVRRIDWRFDGDDTDPRKEFLEGAFADMSHSWADHLSEALTFLPFGWSMFELVYKRRQGAEAEDGASNFKDGKIGWRKLAFRSQDSLLNWVFDGRGVPQAMVQSTYPDFALRTIPFSKGLLYRTTREKNNPEGRSLLRAAYPAYYYAKNLRAVEAIGAERDLAGLPTVRLPSTASTASGSADLIQAQKIVRNVRQDQQAGLIIPHGWEFDLVSSPGSKQFSVGEIIARYETRMAMAFLAQWIMLGMNGTGSYALSSNLTDFFAMSVTTWADQIAATFSQYAIPRLLKLNGMPLENAPKLAHGPLGTPDIDAIGGFLSKLKDYIGPDAEIENWLRGIVEAPRLSEVEIRRRDQEAGEKAAARMAALEPLASTSGKSPAPADKPEQEMVA